MSSTQRSEPERKDKPTSAVTFSLTATLHAVVMRPSALLSTPSLRATA